MFCGDPYPPLFSFRQIFMQLIPLTFPKGKRHLAISYFLVYIAWRDPALSAVSALAY